MLLSAQTHTDNYSREQVSESVEFVPSAIQCRIYSNDLAEAIERVDAAWRRGKLEQVA
jgi:hypothetical protein